ncbi:hypothetical protein BHE74_00019474 [Ensete ventricosum]|nr:hypothetical protein BHE74_00019474 [Ensete ventricosum]
MQGRPPMARPQPMPPARGRLAAVSGSPKGRPAWGQQPAGAVLAGKSTAHGHGRLRPARRGGSRPLSQLLAARHPQRGLTARHPRGTTTCDQPCRQ